MVLYDTDIHCKSIARKNQQGFFPISRGHLAVAPGGRRAHQGAVAKRQFRELMWLAACIAAEFATSVIYSFIYNK
ncbi:MAG: hypothetical protein V4488_13155 [Pseudomonadota bacterium]